jgi:hypothetical protein
MRDKKEIIVKQTIDKIISIVEEVAYGEEYLLDRINFGSKGTIEMIVARIKQEFNA